MELQEKIGAFIRDLRVERGMTQQQLADRLGITDKAVSKWERGLCCPDITLLRPLSDALGVTVTELLAGCRELETVPSSVGEVVLNAISYSENTRQKPCLDWKLLLFMALTAACIIAAVSCMICDLALHHCTYTWSKIVCPSIGFGWLVCAPLLQARQHPVRWSLILLSLAAIPYLCGIGWQLQSPLMIKISICVAPEVLTYLWLAYLLCIRLRHRKCLAAGWIFWLAVPLDAGIRFVLNWLADLDGFYMGTLICLPAAIAFFVADYVLKRRKTEGTISPF